MEDGKFNQIINQLQELNKNVVSIFALLAFQIVVFCVFLAFIFFTVKGIKL